MAEKSHEAYEALKRSSTMLKTISRHAEQPVPTNVWNMHVQHALQMLDFDHRLAPLQLAVLAFLQAMRGRTNYLPRNYHAGAIDLQRKLWSQNTENCCRDPFERCGMANPIANSL